MSAAREFTLFKSLQVPTDITYHCWITSQFLSLCSVDTLYQSIPYRIPYTLLRWRFMMNPAVASELLFQAQLSRTSWDSCCSARAAGGGLFFWHVFVLKPKGGNQIGRLWFWNLGCQWFGHFWDSSFLPKSIFGIPMVLNWNSCGVLLIDEYGIPSDELR